MKFYIKLHFAMFYVIIEIVKKLQGVILDGVPTYSGNIGRLQNL